MIVVPLLTIQKNGIGDIAHYSNSIVLWWVYFQALQPAVTEEREVAREHIVTSDFDGGEDDPRSPDHGWFQHFTPYAHMCTTIMC